MVHVNMYVQVHNSVHVQRMSGILLYLSLPYFLKTGSLTMPGACVAGSLTVPGNCHFSQSGWLVSSGDLPVSTTSRGVTGVCIAMLLFIGAGDQVLY